MIDVIIPTYKPGRELPGLIERLTKQTVSINKIILMNTEQKYFDEMLASFDGNLDENIVEVHHITKSEFDHGRTRNQGVSYSEADIFVMMTQDAMPVDDRFIEELIKPLSDDKVAASYARQVAGPDSAAIERITREFNYPDKGCIKTSEDISKLGIKTYFCSNVSCAYKRTVYNELGGFVDKTIFNEDMIYAAGIIKAGYAISYAAEAKVYHSHNYSAMQQFHRNIDIGVSQADHPEVFGGISSESEGKKMVSVTIKKLCDMGCKRQVIPYIYMTGWKYIGFKLGRNYKKLPLALVRKLSMNPAYFE